MDERPSGNFLLAEKLYSSDAIEGLSYEWGRDGRFIFGWNYRRIKCN